jgi:hypothetical protein
VAWPVVLVAAASGPAFAADPDAANGKGAKDGVAAPQPGAPVGLDRLLKLPQGLEYSTEKRGGATRSEWRARFDDARASLAKAQDALKKAQDALSEAAGNSDAWTMAPPGLPADAANGDSGGTFRLREEVKRERAEVQRTQSHLRDLDIEANLAGVPEDWRGPRPASSTETDSGHDSVSRPAAAP